MFWFEHVPPDSMELPRSKVDFGPEVAKCAFELEDAVFIVNAGDVLGLAPGVACKEAGQAQHDLRRR